MLYYLYVVIVSGPLITLEVLLHLSSLHLQIFDSRTCGVKYFLLSGNIFENDTATRAEPILET